MKILFLTHRYPYPPESGDRIRSFHFIKHLSARHEIHLMSICFGKAPDKEELRPLENFCRTVEVFPVNYWKNIMRCAPFIFSDVPLTVQLFFSKELNRRLKERLERERFDLIYIYSSQMATAVMEARGTAKVMDFIDVDSEKWQEYADRSGHLKKWVYAREARCLRRFELDVERRCRASVLVSENEAALFRRLAPDAKIHAIGNGVDTDPHGSGAPANNDKDSIIFTGVMDYFPNVDGVQWFANEILPLVARKRPEAEFIIIGKNPAPAVRKLAGKSARVKVTGYVPDIKKYLSSAAVAVAPLRIARGIQNKVLEAMAAGVPVVATTPASEGIDARPGADLLIADDAREFSSHVIRLLEDAEFRAQLANSALERVREHYSWDSMAKKMEALMVRAAGTD